MILIIQQRVVQSKALPIGHFSEARGFKSSWESLCDWWFYGSISGRFWCFQHRLEPTVLSDCCGGDTLNDISPDFLTDKT